MDNDARRNGSSPYMTPRGTLMKREPPVTRGYHPFMGHCVWCYADDEYSGELITMGIQRSSDLDLPDNCVDGINSIGESPTPRNSARRGRPTQAKCTETQEFLLSVHTTRSPRQLAMDPRNGPSYQRPVEQPGLGNECGTQGLK